jgi:uncharacterized protein
MRLQAKLVQSIAHDLIQTLVRDEDVEIEAARIPDSEMDMAAVMKEYLAAEEQVKAVTREALQQRGYDESRFDQVQREMAEVRGFKMGEEGIEYVVDQMIEFLLASRNVQEVYADDEALRKTIFDILKKHLEVEDDSAAHLSPGP